MNREILIIKINLLRNMLILWYDLKYNTFEITSFPEYWTILSEDISMCVMLKKVIEIEDKVANGNNPTSSEFDEMNRYYKRILISPRIRKFLQYDKKN
jgi:hypothetical protein